MFGINLIIDSADVWYQLSMERTEELLCWISWYLTISLKIQSKLINYDKRQRLYKIEKLQVRENTRFFSNRDEYTVRNTTTQ